MKCPYKGFRRSLMQKQVFDKNNPYYNKILCHQTLSYIWNCMNWNWSGKSKLGVSGLLQEADEPEEIVLISKGI